MLACYQLEIKIVIATTASAAWYQHTPSTIRRGTPLTSPGRTYDGNYMAIELTGSVTNSSYPSGSHNLLSKTSV